MSLAPIVFREHYLHSGKLHYAPESQEAEDVLEFMKMSEYEISEYDMDRIFDWLTKLGHEVIIYEDYRGRGI